MGKITNAKRSFEFGSDTGYGGSKTGRQDVYVYSLKRLLSVVLAGILLGPAPALAQTEEENGATLAAALVAANQGDWDGAQALARMVSDPVAGDIIEWTRLRDGTGSFSDYRAFLQKNPDWPGLDYLRQRGEASIPEKDDPKTVLAYFKGNPPQTGTGVLRLAEAYMATGKIAEAREFAILAWRNFSMEKDERVRLLNTFEQTLAPHHTGRLDMLLWRGLTDEAQAMEVVVPESYAKLAEARIGLRRMQRNVDALIAAVPADLQDDPGLAYERFLWRDRKGRYDDARDLMLAQSVSKKALGRPERWADRRRDFARQEMRDGHANAAYKLASNHFLTEGEDFADLEWLSGYIALRKLNKPKLAIEHFKRFQAAVASPISNGRAGYWLGRAYEAVGDQENAKKAYLLGAENQTSFYGQLAAERAGAAADTSLTGAEAFPNWRAAKFMSSSVMHAALLFHYAGLPYQTERFMKHLAESQDRTGNQQLADPAMELNRPSIAVRLSKQAAGAGMVLPKTYFPLTELAGLKTRLKPEVAMSIARRESELDESIQSPAGARGLMQVMPRTARKVAKELGIDYSLDSLSTDWRYNATIGSAYLADQLEAFNGSYILAFAAYNAGPSRANRWRQDYGDPTNDQMDQVDFIENIPFTETRNYVMRVIESLHVYRARLAGKTPPLQISKDLKKG